VVIRVEHLVKKYKDLTAVDDISFKVKRKEVFAFLGPNGAGKTTTVEILECLRNPTSGLVEVLGYDVSDKKGQDEIKMRIGASRFQYIRPTRLSRKSKILCTNVRQRQLRY